VKDINEKYELLISENKVIELEMNPIEPELIERLNKGFYILNRWDIRGLDGRSVHPQLIYLHIILKVGGNQNELQNTTSHNTSHRSRFGQCMYRENPTSNQPGKVNCCGQHPATS
jgi:hypothetical protein